MAEILAIFGTAVEAVINVKKCALTPITNQFGYLCCYSGNLQILRDQVEKLNEKRNDLQLEVDTAKRNAEVIGREVEKWMEDVVKLNERKERILQDTAQVQQGCFYGICPNVKLRYRLSREAKKTSEAAQGLHQEVSQIIRISYPAPLEPIPTASAGIEVDSRKSKEEEIMKALKDDKVYVIALCGMGGVGKTTLANKIQSKVRKGKMFEEVVITVVSRPLDLKNVQQGIAERLGLNLSEHTTPARAERLHKRLKDMESVLIILDDVWEKFNLQEIGIPSKTTHQRCKIILTSRIQHVCRNIEDSAKIIQLDVLSEQEAWNLFKAKAGETVHKPNLHPIAMDVARECKGLPLALVTVAAALKNSNMPSWKDALHQLKASMATDIQEVHEEVYVPLKWSYDQLRNEEARYLFLLCCLFPEDYEIPLHELLEYGFALRIFANTDNLEVARNRVYRLVEMLIDRFLLIHVDLKGNDYKRIYFMKFRVKMHDVIRDMAISIASKDKHAFMVIHDNNLREWPKKSCYDKYTCISVSSSSSIALPEKLDCPRLELLRVDSPGVEIQESSCDGMRRLKVLHTCQIKSLPSSLSLLRNLQSLFLVNCKLEILPNEVGELVNLEILSLSDSGIKVLPEGIGRLKNLKLLDLTDCRYLENIPPGVISGLAQLEELYMNSFGYWEGIKDTNASIAEVASLTNLRTLQLHAYKGSIDLLRDTGNWHKLMRYHVAIGSHLDMTADCGNLDRCISLALFGSSPLTDLVQVLFDNAQAIELEGSGSAETANKLLRQGYKNVERLVLRYDLEFLFDSSSWNLPDIGFLPCLTTLVLEKNAALKEICRGQPPIGSFSNLTSIKLYKCKGLKNLFSFSVVAMLSKLEFLEIVLCQATEAVFFEQNRQYRDDAIITFPKLSKIRLFSLPSLVAFCEATDHEVSFEFPQLHELEIEYCSSLRSFRTTKSSSLPEGEQPFFLDHKVNCIKLEVLRLCSISTATIFGPKIPSHNFNGLQEVEIVVCRKLRSIFSTPMFKGLINLQVLKVRKCPMLEELIPEEEKELQFPQLKELELIHLPKIRGFCHLQEDIEFPSLETLTINHCSMLQSFCTIDSSNNQLPEGNSCHIKDEKQFFFHQKVRCCSLKEVRVQYLSCNSGVFSSKIPVGNFNKLESLKLEHCSGFLYVFPSSKWKAIPNLKYLRMKNCEMLQEVIAKDQEEEEEQTSSKVTLFPQLEVLYLDSLPKMQQFCHMNPHLEFPSLQKLRIESCSLMEIFPRNPINLLPTLDIVIEYFFVEVSFRKLKNLYLSDVQGAIQLFSHKISIGNFNGLDTVVIYRVYLDWV